MTEDKLMELFANNEHERWSNWHKHAKKNWTSENVERWDKLADTPYSELCEELKQKDRDEVMPYWVGIKSERDKVEKLGSQMRMLELALRDAVAGMEYIKETHGELYGVGWDRIPQWKKVIAEIAKEDGE